MFVWVYGGLLGWWCLAARSLTAAFTFSKFCLHQSMFWLSFVVLDHDLNRVATSKSSSSTIPDSRFCYCLCGKGEGCLQCDVTLARVRPGPSQRRGGLICLLGWNWNQNMHGYYGYEAWVSFMGVLCDRFNSMVTWCQDQDVIDSKSLTSITSVSIMYACGSGCFPAFIPQLCFHFAFFWLGAFRLASKSNRSAFNHWIWKIITNIVR